MKARGGGQPKRPGEAGAGPVLDAVTPTCVQPLVTHRLVSFTCQGAGTEFVRGLICAVLAAAAFFSGLACFWWAAHLRSVQQMTRIGQSQAGARRRLFG
jgi:hypothetical protein